ncbi:hypothetical protein PFICI_10516 [Pestalotiopsis fici W106-1]|uniref:Heterokaryon incompatibility domain-containing protein n=1 Tax=Pestalotiopsis fici (strain W106-1 / CGMCC3.15140) TaxID=1229662 RepID=W3WXC7_PESFW|nr:uncharacterized protein PFICI_10516 [Pestalotiopsis fici W106-1]ETS78454.1 hypothetical protein PFICI_10516 [Pestalotiopsis fici W106-1]
MQQQPWNSSYEYRPFAPVRLLHVFRHSDDSIRGTLQNFSLDSLDCPQFTSISYVWGPQVYSHAILVDGHYFPVLDSVYSILEALCDSSAFQDEYWVWIDSICINLRDPQERASQVLLMKQIYSRSKHTIAWLGEKSAELEEGIAFMAHLANSYSDILEFNQTRNSREVPERLWLPDKWRALGVFLDLPWWKRIWTLQEYVSSRTIDLYCGSDHVSEDILMTALTAIWHCEPSSLLLRPDVWTPAWTRDRLRSWYQAKVYSENMSIVALMAYSGACELTDPRDRIYGLLGLAKESDRAMIGRPAYADDVGDIYLRLVESFISTYQSIDIICFAQIFRAVQSAEANEECLDHQWPSWLPDWRVRVVPFVTPLMVSQTSGRHIGNFRPPMSSFDWEVDSAAIPYRAHADMAGLVDIDYQTRHLKCQGFFVDLVDGLGGALESPDHSSTQSASPLVQSTSVWNTQSQKQDINPLEFITDLVRTLTLDREDRYLMFPAAADDFRNEFLNLVHISQTDRRELLPARCKSACAWYDANKSLLLQGHTLEEICLESSSSPMFAASLDAVGADEASFASRLIDCTSPITMQRKLLVTASGLIGMAPPHARKGDIVCVLLGCSVPVMLRELRADQQFAYSFVGECYIHGIMDGEVADWGRELRDLTII